MDMQCDVKLKQDREPRC